MVEIPSFWPGKAVGRQCDAEVRDVETLFWGAGQRDGEIGLVNIGSLDVPRPVAPSSGVPSIKSHSVRLVGVPLCSYPGVITEVWSTLACIELQVQVVFLRGNAIEQQQG